MYGSACLQFRFSGGWGKKFAMNLRQAWAAEPCLKEQEEEAKEEEEVQEASSSTAYSFNLLSFHKESLGCNQFHLCTVGFVHLHVWSCSYLHQCYRG